MEMIALAKDYIKLLSKVLHKIYVEVNVYFYAGLLAVTLN